MTKAKLSEIFRGFAVKRLTAHQVDPSVSNGHEFQGSGSLRRLLGSEERRKAPCVYHWLSDDDDPRRIESTISWYDSRKNKPKRSPEWRLYYSAEAGELVQGLAKAGDLAVVALDRADVVHVVLAAAGSTWERRLLVLFSLPDGAGSLFDVVGVSDSSEVGFDEDFLLEALGVSVPAAGDGGLEMLVAEIRRKYGVVGAGGVEKLPSTETMSREARASFVGPSAVQDPDGFLYGVMEWETRIFKVYERELVGDRILRGFVLPDGTADVEGFFAFGKSMGQSRFSRAGHAFQHHIDFLLREHGVVFSGQAVTEAKKKPDFIFPGGWLYAEPSFPNGWLNMLGVKTTGKDRWRQLINEADRIERKHYLTIEAPISSDQLSEMEAEDIQPVIPIPRHRLFEPADVGRLMSVSRFIEHVLDIQSAVGDAGWPLQAPAAVRSPRSRRTRQ